MGVLIAHLPNDSATIRTLVPATAWTMEAHLLASLVEVFDSFRKHPIVYQGDGKKYNPKDPKRKPISFDRPGLPSKYERKGTSLGQLMQIGGGEQTSGD